MDIEKFESQTGTESKDFENVDKLSTSTLLDQIRNWTRNKVLLGALALVTAGGVPACDTQDDFANQQIEVIKQDSYPFAVCFTNALYYTDTNEYAGFNVNYIVPEGKQFDTVLIQVLDDNEDVIYDELRENVSGSDKIRFLEDEIPGVTESTQVKIIVNGEYVLVRNVDFWRYDDDPIGI